MRGSTVMKGHISIGKVVIDGQEVLENYHQAIDTSTTGPRIALVGCSSEKAATPCEARELYTSQLFRAARAYAEATCQRWYILSAKYGVLHPLAVIAPYDVELTPAVLKASGWGERVGQQLDQLIPWPAEANAELVVLAGRKYVDAIDLPDDREIYWEEPLRGMGIGERLAWLKSNTPRRTA